MRAGSDITSSASSVATSSRSRAADDRVDSRGVPLVEGADVLAGEHLRAQDPDAAPPGHELAERRPRDDERRAPEEADRPVVPVARRIAGR